MSSRMVLVGVSLIFLASRAQAQPETTASLVKRLGDKKKVVRVKAMRDLGKRGTAAKEAVPLVAAIFHTAEAPDEVCQAAATLAQLGPDSVPELVKAFKDARVEQARQSATALARMGPAAKEAVPYLIEALRDRDPVVRAWSAQALGEIGVVSDESVAGLFHMVADPVPAVRQAAGLSLVRAGRKAVPGLRVILEEMRGPDPSEAATILGLMGAEAEEALPELLAALEIRKPRMRAAAAKALAGMKGKAKEIVPSLVKALGAEKEYLAQQQLFQALTAVGEQDVPGFLEDLRRLNREGNWAAPFALARFGPRGKDAVKPLIQMLKEPDPGMRLAATLALGQVGAEAAEAAPHLQLLLKDGVPQVRGAAAQAIFKIDPRQEALALRQFEVALDQAEIVLGRMGPSLTPAVVMVGPGLDVRKRPVDRRLFFEPSLQKRLRDFMDFHILLNSATANANTVFNPLVKRKLEKTAKLAGQMLQNLGPEAIPVFVHGVNQAMAFRLGFC